MSGAGRRSHYRKHLTDQVLNELPEPSSDERIAKVVATRGSNQFDILLPQVHTSNAGKENFPRLAILPTKFRKLIWLKRGDFVIVKTGGEEETEDGDEGDTGGVRFIISHILYKDQVKHLRAKEIWPASDPAFADSAIEGISADDAAGVEHPASEAIEEAEDGIVYDAGYDDEEESNDEGVFVNSNRRAKPPVEEESESDD